ncbi:AlwI family type II restriction endonuclease, partial [Cetobacterium sp.]|uniref:AlwI family type II restriction endonuclease n=1 Tax=Cetobacterium sp. TaxID=2071632 RepID=UPI003EE75A89
RNPQRLQSFLTVLSLFQNQNWNNQVQENFFRSLIQHRVYGYGNSQFYRNLNLATVSIINNLNHPLTPQDVSNILLQKNYEDGPSFRGRTAAKPLEKLGYAQLYPVVQILANTQIRTLLDGLLQWTEQNQNYGSSIKPFIGAVHFFNSLNQTINNFNGLTHDEFSLFITTLNDHNYINAQVQNVINFRQKTFNWQYHLSCFENSENYLDYGNNLIRYYLQSGIFIDNNGLINLNYQNSNVLLILNNYTPIP